MNDAEDAAPGPASDGADEAREKRILKQLLGQKPEKQDQVADKARRRRHLE